MQLVTQYVQGCCFKWEVVLRQRLILQAPTYLQQKTSFQEWAFQRHLLRVLALILRLGTFNSLNLACLQVSQHHKIGVLLTTVLFQYLGVLDCACQPINLFPLDEFFCLLHHEGFESLFLLTLSSRVAFLVQPFTVALFPAVLFAAALFVIALLAALLLFVSVAFLQLLLQRHLPPICVKPPPFLTSLFLQLIQLQLQLLRQQTFDQPFLLPDVLFLLFLVLALPLALPVHQTNYLLQVVVAMTIEQLLLAQLVCVYL